MQDTNERQSNREKRLFELYGLIDAVINDIENTLQNKHETDIQRDAFLESMKSIEREVEFIILFTKEEDGKLSFTNQAQRDNEKIRRLNDNNAYNMLREQYVEKSTVSDQLKNKLEVVNYRFKGLQMQVQLETIMVTKV